MKRLVIVLALALAGCTEVGASPTPSASPVVTPSVTPAPTARPTPIPSLDPALAACHDAVTAAWQEYSETLKAGQLQWSLQPTPPSVAVQAALYYKVEKILFDAVGKADCPPSVAKLKATFLDIETKFVALLKRMAAGKDFTVSEFQSLNQGSNEAWMDFAATVHVQK